MRVLTEQDLKVKVPSIFATTASAKVSEKYSLIPTIDIVRGMLDAGYKPVKAEQSKGKSLEHAKHMIRFRHNSFLEVEKGELVPEIVLFNSHDGTSSYQLRAGLFRLVCMNGLVVGNPMFEQRVRHKGDVIGQVIDAANTIIDVLPTAIQKVDEWKNIKLNDYQKVAFAESAMLLKYKPEEKPFNPQNLLQPRRWFDKENDVFTVMNVVQENLIRGGIRYRDPQTRRRNSTRSVSSVSEDIRLNTALWTLTEKLTETINRVA